MASTKISDMFVPELATTYTSQEATAKNAFFQSGVAFADPRVPALMDGYAGGQIISMPFFKALDGSEANIGSDDPDVKSVARKITTGYETAVKTYQNVSYSAMDLAGMAAGADPMTAINLQINTYWTGQAEKRIIAATTGIIADSVANHDSDLLYDITQQTGAGQDAYLGAASMNTAAGYLGEYMSDITAVCVHPTVFTNLQNRNLINFVREADNNTLFPVYGNFRIIVDKNMPVVSVGNGQYAFYSYLFGNAAISFNYGNPGVEYEIDRNPDAGNGAGEDLLYSRRCDLVLPRGYKTDASGKAGLNLAALRSAATWTRVWDERERIKIVAVASLG